VREGGGESSYVPRLARAPFLRAAARAHVGGRWRRAGGVAARKGDGGRRRGREKVALESRRGREMAAGRAELDGGAHGLPQHVEELGRHALPGRAVAGQPTPPPSEPRPAPDPDPAGARGGSREQEEQQRGGAA
jgi:hypothetical protein